MFEVYGPNSLVVNSYIEALQELTTEQLAVININDYELTNIKAIIERVNNLKDIRSVERALAKENAHKAVTGKGYEWQQLLTSEIGGWLVLEDHLESSERNFMYLYLLNQFISLKVLRDKYQKEDWAIEDFCDQLSKVDNQRVFIHSRPDAKGKGGMGLPDFIISRKGVNYTVEHTSINTYEKQEHYNRLWDKFIKPLEIEKKVNNSYPNKWVNIHIPIDAFKSQGIAQRYDFDIFLKKLLEAVGETIRKTPKSFNLAERHIYAFNNPDFDVSVSIDEGFNGCFVIRIAPTNSEQTKNYLDKEIVRAITKKQPKLNRAKEKGENTILLLDSDDYAFVNVDILSEAFRREVSKKPSIAEGIDEIYILHRGGSGLVVPVKLAERFYPELPEYREYKLKELNIQNFK